MTVQNVEIKPDVSTEGVARVSARKPVDMQRSAGRLLRAAAEKFYDAEIDIDWDSPWEEGKYFLPEHRVSLYGTKLATVGAHAAHLQIPAEDQATFVQFARIGLPQECVNFCNQRRNAGFFVHRLVGQRAKFATQSGNHPTRQIDIASFDGAKMLFDRNHFLLCDKSMPAAKALRIFGRVAIICGHVGAHDAGGVAGNVQPGLKTILRAHAGDAFAVNRLPRRPLRRDEIARLAGGILVQHGFSLFGFSHRAPTMGCALAQGLTGKRGSATEFCQFISSILARNGD